MNETKRTPGKWIVLGNDNALIVEPREENRRIIIATGLLKEHADYICRAVNCHDRLVEYVRGLRAIAQQDYEREVSVWGKGDDSEEMEAAIGKLDALIAEAEGGGK